MQEVWLQWGKTIRDYESDEYNDVVIIYELFDVDI